ncbi:kinase-like protein [Rhizopogon vinicolor AM-OR11-026]|uniref:Kinase-like protein n=1 Tax=Rhizopogon vinicolor AM-OR11-026 TaxID=1314800 RepID=A0A1B7MK39_9AGAM|nr:kinase-like protein [Rhizopogon vinicolor AM-OR11-026]
MWVTWSHARNDLTGLISRPTGVHASGTYAEVHQYELKDSRKSTKLIAAKSYKPTSYEKIRSEIALLSGISHHNVVPFLGFKDDRGSISLVMSWMSGGTLTSFIRTHGEALETPDKSTLLHDIASGLQHLHSNFVIHGNLESDNILINEQHRACLSGFRQSVKLSSMEAGCPRSQMPRKPAIQFAGPEWFAGRNDTRSQSLPNSLFKSDVYSLGCVIFYIFTKCMPWGDDASSTDISDKLRQDITPPRPKGSVIDDKQWDLIAPCLSHVPQRRPQDLLKRIQEYLVYVGPCDLSGQITLPQAIARERGGYGDVYELIWNRKTGGEVKVAVKIMRPMYTSSEDLAKNLKRELAAWRRLYHPNIVPLLGTSNFPGGIKGMVSLWMENGSLEKYMNARENGELPSLQRLQWAKDIAGGLKHLHEFPIIHGDLTPLNVLIDNEGRAVLTDFGLSVILGGFASVSCTYTEGKPGTVAWAAPELFIDGASLINDSKDVLSPSPSKESDVYSFACLMYLIFSGRHPWVVRHEAELVNIISRVRSGTRPPNPGIEARYWGLIVQCWAPAPNSRPTISKVLQQLQ